MGTAVIGIDVGTGSARAGVFDETGTLIATAKHPIRMWREAGEIVEQSSNDIWAACCASVRAAMAEAAVAPQDVKGIGFDATCSMAVLGRDGAPLAVSASGDAERNVIVWMDHRALQEAREINAKKHAVLDYVGGIISPEMETPKLLWLSRHMPETFAAAAHFFDLADFLTWRATGATTRSSCTITCKWTYLAHENRWDDDYFRGIGLEALAGEGHARIGTEIASPGTPIGRGLDARAAQELGLREGTPVAASLIDAHAGGVATVGARIEGETGDVDVFGRLAYIMGTSACIMATTREPKFVPGVWGPYYSAMVPDLWLNEGGQSAAGVGIDHLVQSHRRYPQVVAEAEAAGVEPLELLERRAVGSGALGEAALLARGLHVLPEFMGNRSPHADPGARAVVAGLDLDTEPERVFVAALCGLAYGLADVVDAMRTQGIACDTLVMSGGASRSDLVRQIIADVTGLKVALPQTAEPVLLGAAVLGAVAGGLHPTLTRAMEAMTRIGRLSAPTPPKLQAFHRAKREVYARMRRLDLDARALMAQGLEAVD
jgi:D-ribulokinase